MREGRDTVGGKGNRIQEEDGLGFGYTVCEVQV